MGTTPGTTPPPRPGEGAPRRAPWSSVVDAGRLPTAQAYPTFGVELRPPGPDDQPAFDAAAALQHYAARFPPPRSGTGPTVTLARLLGRPAPEGAGSRDHGTFLVYVLRWEHVTVTSSGPAPARAERPAARRRRAAPRGRNATSYDGIVMGWIDARTGELISTVQTGRPGLPGAGI